MGCCSSNDTGPTWEDVHFQKIPSREEIKYDKNFKGPLVKRSCTDIFCLLIFVAFLCGWAFVAHFALRNGDLDRVLVPTDSDGRKCGIDSAVTDKKYLFFFDLAKCIDASVPFVGCRTPQVCVERCPKTRFLFDFNACRQDFSTTLRKLICRMDVDKSQIRSCDDIETKINEDKCAKWYLESKSFTKRCIPKNVTELYDLAKEHGTDAEHVLEGALSVKEFIRGVANFQQLGAIGEQVVEDVIATWYHILIGLLLAIISCMILIAVMRWIAKPFIWLSILGVLSTLGFGTYYCFKEFQRLKNRPVTDTIVASNLLLWVKAQLEKPNTWLYFAIALSVLFVVLFLVILVLRKRIAIAAALVKEGSKAVSSIWSTVLFPIFPWILQITVAVFAVVIGLYLASVGDPVNQIVRLQNDTSCLCTGPAAFYKDGSICDPLVFKQNCKIVTATHLECKLAACNFKEISSPPKVSIFQAYNVFGFFWGLFFISALGEMVLAATFATWYWTFDKDNVPFFTLTVGLGRTVRYHLGTVAFGSLVITICRIIRVILEYIDQKIKKWDNEFTRCILCCLRCFFWCLERFLRFLSKNAYIMCAIHGKPFCTSARDAFNLLMRNFLRVIALDQVTDFLFFLTKLLVTIGTGATAYLYFTNDASRPELHYIAVPVTIVMIGTYLIASVFFSVYSMAVDTLFLCFLEDCERNDGSEEKPFFMSKQLMKILGKKNVVSHEQYE